MTDTDRMASAYGVRASAYADVLDPSLRPVHDRLVRLGGVGPGTRVLDLATGTGAIARIAAALGGDVVGVDLSPGMVELARSRSGQGVRFEVADAGALRYEAASFDVVTCGFGLSHLPDVHGVLEGVRRLLVPGGCFVEASWGADGSNPAFSAVLSTLKARAPHGLHSFLLDEGTWANPGRGAAILTAAGFVDVSTQIERLEGEYSSAEAAIEWTLAWPDYGETFDLLDRAEQAEFRAASIDAVNAAGDLRWWFAINYYRAGSGLTEPA